MTTPNTPTDPSREAFEARYKHFDLCRSLVNFDEYGDYITQNRWDAWQAAISHASGAAVNAEPSESYPKDWARLVLMVSPTGEYHSIGGDLPPGADPRADNELVGMTRLRKRFAATPPATPAPIEPGWYVVLADHLDGPKVRAFGKDRQWWTPLGRGDGVDGWITSPVGYRWFGPIAGIDDPQPFLVASPPAPAAPSEGKPIDMILYCPNCGKQHIDDDPDFPDVHRSHLCREKDGGCGMIWRPADVPTNGVASIQTEGKDDKWVVYPGEIDAQPATPAPSDPHAELRKTYRIGDKWQMRGKGCYPEWRDCNAGGWWYQPGWDRDLEYQRKPDDAAPSSPSTAGEQPSEQLSTTIRKSRIAFDTHPSSPQAPQGNKLTGCACRWNGDEYVEKCELHEAWHVALHEWAERAKKAEAALAQPRAPQGSDRAEISWNGFHLKGSPASVAEVKRLIHQSGREEQIVAELVQARAALASQQKREPLSDDVFFKMARDCGFGMVFTSPDQLRKLKRSIEQAHGIGITTSPGDQT